MISGEASSLKKIINTILVVKMKTMILKLSHSGITSTNKRYVKRCNDGTKWMYFLIKDKLLLDNYIKIWDTAG